MVVDQWLHFMLEKRIVDGDVLGKLEFQPPDETSGTDAILIGAEIRAVAETTFLLIIT